MIDALLNAFRAMTEYVRHAFASLPTVIIILLIIAFVVMVITIILTFLAMRRAAPKAPAPPSKDDAAGDAGKEVEEGNGKLPPLGGWISEYLSKKGVFHVSPLSLSFLKALDFLKTALGTYNYKYTLPWYVLIGSSGSGKTALLEGSELELPVGKPDFGIHQPNPECKWWFLKRGVVLDIRGNLLLNAEGRGAEEKGWRSLLILLSRYRAARPVNGIILTIPATELYGRHKLSKDDISNRAEFLSHKLATMQSSLGLRLPVYVVVTKTDTIPGFQSFCGEIPSSNRHNMLGWTCPYTPTTTYTPKWVEEAFFSLEETLNQIRLEIFAEGRLNEAKDGVFVFPSEILTIKENLSLYMDQIFKVDTYQEPLLLRGMYFTGDSGMMPLKIIGEEDTEDDNSFAAVGTTDVSFNVSENDKLSLASQLSRTDVEPEKRKIFFIDELIAEKVFKEGGLSVPLRRRLLTANRALNIAKISTAAFVLLGSYGLFNAYEKFIRSRDYIIPVLSKMNVLLREMHQVKISQAGYSNELFDTYARQLIEMMEQIQDTKFFSIFVPASWFSPLHKDLNKSLKISYQQIIIRTIYIDLLLKARDLLHMRPGPQEQSAVLSQLLQPTASTEYQTLKRYIDGIATLHEKIEKFNQLKLALDSKDLNDLVAYTFNAQLPQEFVDHYSKFRDLLRNTPFPPIDLKPYQQLARETLNVLYQNFLNGVFNTTNANSLPGRLTALLQQLGQQDANHLPTLDYLRQVSLDLSQVCSSLGEPGKTWMDGEYFNGGKEFEELLNKIDNSKLFGKEVTQFLVDQTSVAFNNLRLQLQALNRWLVESPGGATLAPLAAKQAQVFPSQGILALDKSLSVLFSEPYMGAPSPQILVTNIPSGKIVYWDAKIIQTAYEMSKRYEDFVSKQISTFPVTFQENFRILAHQSLQANVVNLLGKAQSFVDLPSIESEGLAAEEILRSKIGDFKEVAPKFIKLLEVLNQNAVGASFVELRNLLSSTSYWLLARVEDMMRSLSIYTIKDVTFSWWDGQTGAALNGFSAKDVEDLKTYITLQGQQIQTLANDFAKPLVSFLTSGIMLEAAGDKALLNRWRRISDQVESYTKKQPGNTLSTLEEFILKTLNNYDLKNTFSQISPEDIRQESGDFFLEQIRILKKGVLSRAEVLKRQQGMKYYKDLADFFEQNLKDKFPFINLKMAGKITEIDPEILRDFFKKFDEAGGSAKAIFDQIYQLGNFTDPCLQFLLKMQEIRSFLGAYLDSDSNGDGPFFNFSMDFRVNRDKENGGDLIVDWTFKPDEDTSINKNDKAHEGKWTYGNSIEIGFRWPANENIPAQPIKDPNQPLLSVEGSKATFRYTGRWSLLWMLRLHGVSKGGKNMKGANPSMLRFMIPTGPESRAVVYNAITLFGPSSNPKTPGKVLKVPDFPVSAPSLPREVSNYANQAVLTEGMIKANEPKELVNSVAASESPSSDPKASQKDTPKT